MPTKPCPFCGCLHVTCADLNPTRVVCLKCDAHGPMKNGRNSAIRAWNRRKEV